MQPVKLDLSNCTRNQIISRTHTYHASNFASSRWCSLFLSNHLRTSKLVSLVLRLQCYRSKTPVSRRIWTKEGRTNLRNLKWTKVREREREREVVPINRSGSPKWNVSFNFTHTSFASRSSYNRSSCFLRKCGTSLLSCA